MAIYGPNSGKRTGIPSGHSRPEVCPLLGALSHLVQLTDQLQRLRLGLKRRVGQDADDLLQQVFLEVAPRWCNLQLDNPAAYLQRVINFQICAWSRERIKARSLCSLWDIAPLAPNDPLEELLEHEREARLWKLVTKGILTLQAEYAEMMRRCLSGQSRDQVMSEMHLNPTQYRLCKSRAKQQLIANIGRLRPRLDGYANKHDSLISSHIQKRPRPRDCQAINHETLPSVSSWI